MSSFTIPGILTKYDPSFSLSEYTGSDGRIAFNGDQFVAANKTNTGGVVGVSVGKAVDLNVFGAVIEGWSYDDYRDAAGVYRLINGDPVDGIIGRAKPRGCNYALIIYADNVTTNEIKFWTRHYIDPEYLRVDRGYTSSALNEISGISVDISFDRSLKHHELDAVAAGQYEYTVNLGGTYEGRCWRIRSFIYANCTEVIPGTNRVKVLSTEGWPSSGQFSHLGGDIRDLRRALLSFSGLGLSGNKLVLSDPNVVIPSRQGGDYGWKPVTGLMTEGALFLFKAYETRARGGLYLGDSTALRYRKNIVSLGVAEAAEGTLRHVFQTGDPLDEDYNPDTSPFYLDLVGNVSGVTAGFYDRFEGECEVRFFPRYSGDPSNFSRYRWYRDFEVEDSTTFSNVLPSTDDQSQGGFENQMTMFPGTALLYEESGLDITQVSVAKSTDSQFRYWFSDGTYASTKIFDQGNVGDFVYDVNEGLYYLAVPDTGIMDVDANDTFSNYTVAYPSIAKWSTVGTLYRVDTVSGTLSAHHDEVGTDTKYGSIVTNSYTGSSDFDVAVDSGFVRLDGAGIFYVASAVSRNFLCGVGFEGPFTIDNPAGSSHSFVASSPVYLFGQGIESVSNLKLDIRNLPEGHYWHVIARSGHAWYYTRIKISGSDMGVSNVYLGTSGNIMHDMFTVTLQSKRDTSADSSVAFITRKESKGNLLEQAPLSIQSVGGKVSVHYNGVELGAVDSAYGSYVVGLDIISDDDTYAYFSDFLAAGGDFKQEVPTLKVVTTDAYGNIKGDTGVSDSDGVVIAGVAPYRSGGISSLYLAETCAITTNQKDAADGGSLYVKIGSNVYKYDKDDLPIATIDDGTLAATTASGVMRDYGFLCFGYDGHSAGGLSYMYPEMHLGNYYIEQFSADDLTRKGLVSALDLNIGDEYNFVRDSSDLETLYAVGDNGTVNLFNISDESVAFCSVRADKQIMQAGTGDICSVTAYVTDLYGLPLANRQVNFAVVAGDGQLTSVSICTTSSGTATTGYVVGESVGVVNITATALNTICT